MTTSQYITIIDYSGVIIEHILFNYFNNTVIALTLFHWTVKHSSSPTGIYLELS